MFVIPEIEAVMSLVVGMLTSLSLWAYLKPKYVEIQEGRELKVNYYKFKRNYGVFASLLKERTPIKTCIENTAEIILGNAESKLEVVIVTNPLCGHCKAVHALVEDILDRYGELVRIVIRFNLNLSEPQSKALTIASTLMKIHLTKGEGLSLLALHDAFQEPLESWGEQWAWIEDNSRHYLEDLKRQKSWCESHKINFTPVILINGRPFPAPYVRQDLIFCIEDLHEDSLYEPNVREAITL